MPRNTGRTDLIAERGENLVKIGFAKILQWVARKDSPDDGIDLNVEIPAEGTYPSERFLVQVKTASVVKPRSNGSWPASVRTAALRKYKRSRHAVFLFAVDLNSEEIRWTDLADALRREPARRTFLLPITHKFDQQTIDIFRHAVRSAIEVQNDSHHPPAQALAYRARQLEAKDPRFTVRGEIIGGVERYTRTVKPGFAPKVKFVPLTKADAKRLGEAVEFGSAAKIKLKSIQIDGLPALTDDETRDSFIKIEPKSRGLRLAITSHLGVGGSEKSYLELDAKVARGVRGFEVRSDDLACPFQFVLKLKPAQSSCAFTIEIHYEKWNGRPFTRLPLIDQILAIARCFSETGRLTFEVIDYGERREVLSAHTEANRSAKFKQTIIYLQLLRKVSQICRQIGSVATYSDADILDIEQVKSLELAYYLLTEKASITLTAQTYTVNPSPDGRTVLLASEPGAVLVCMPMHLHFGKTRIGNIPVRVTINDFVAVDNTDGTIALRPKSSTELCLDTDPPQPQL
jgi:hypothetical protein